MLRRAFVKSLSALGIGGPLLSPLAPRPSRTSAPDDETDVRAYWMETLTRIAAPVLENLAAGTLRANMPVEEKPGADRDRAPVTHLEAFGRTMAGIAPWIELGPDDTEEGQLRATYIDLAQQAMANAVDPASPDFMNFTEERQPLVDAAFLAHAILRAPQTLWEDLDETVRRNLVDALKSSRVIVPPYNNWLLFSAMVEAALLKTGEDADAMRIGLALQKTREWYIGDGHFSDGVDFHWDYYNSFVIQPFLLDILRVAADEKVAPMYGGDDWYARELARQTVISQRYGAIQERLISPEGTFPPIGRSITYRFGAFQLLSQLALMEALPPSLSPAQVRSGLTAVIRKVMEAESLFDDNGWLRLGLYGSQPDLAESYISTGSLYLCTTVFLPLGLPAAAPFWTSPPEAWTSKKIWNGGDLPADHALSERDIERALASESFSQ